MAEEIQIEMEDHGSQFESISSLFGDDDDDTEDMLAEIVSSDKKAPEKKKKVQKVAEPQKIELELNQQDEDLDSDEYPGHPMPRKRSADLSAEVVAKSGEKRTRRPDKKKSSKDSGRRTPESRRDPNLFGTISAEEVIPQWFADMSEKDQTNMVTFYSGCLQRATNPSGEIATDDVYETMEEKFMLGKSKVRDLHLFLNGEALPQGTSDREAEDVVGQYGGNKREQTALTQDELLSVETVFNTLSLFNQGIEVVSFRTLLGHFHVPIQDHEITSLFDAMEQDFEGYVTWARMVKFLRSEQPSQDIEANRVLLIASIKHPEENVENQSSEPSQADSNENELPPAAKAWLDDARNTLTGGVSPSEPRQPIDLQLPPVEVPGGFTKSDLLTDHEDLFDLSPSAARAALVDKLHLCCVPCNFHSENNIEKMYRKQKQDLLVNISQYVSETKKWFSEQVLISMKDLIMYNIFRSLPYSPPAVLFDPDDDPKLDLAWEHLHSCYEILLRLVIAPFTKDKLIRKHLDTKFLMELVNMFMSEDPRERDYLKVILHRFYGKFLKPRPHIRKTMHEMLYSFTYNYPFLPGVCEILEILGSIINGFSIPLKEEHQDFLRNVLIPLHKAPVLMDFSAQLNYCITQFVAKDPSLTPEILEGLLTFWPLQSSQKEVLFLTEIEAILDIVDSDCLDSIVEQVFAQLGKCMCSVHFQVAEQALNLTANETISYYITRQRTRIVPILYPYLQKNLRSHWHDTVRSVTVNILATLREMDSQLYKKIVLETKQQRKELEELRGVRKDRWSSLTVQVKGSQGTV